MKERTNPFVEERDLNKIAKNSWVDVKHIPYMDMADFAISSVFHWMRIHNQKSRPGIAKELWQQA